VTTVIVSWFFRR